jgi:hypothetical protein
MYAILAIIANGGRAIILIYREAGRNKLISYSLYKYTKPFDGGYGQPLAKRLPGVGSVPTSKPCRWRGKRLDHGGGVCELCVSGVLLCFASKNSSKREFFVPAGTDLAVKLLTFYVSSFATEKCFYFYMFAPVP